MGVCQAVRTTDHPANHKPPPNDPPPHLGATCVGELEPWPSSARGSPGPLLSLRATLSLLPTLPALNLGHTLTSVFYWFWYFSLFIFALCIFPSRPNVSIFFSF